MKKVTEVDGFKLLTKKEIEHDQDGIFQAVRGLDDRIKANALQCMAHGKAHGDVRLMERLVSVLPKGFWDAGFRSWLYAHSPIRADAATGHFKQAKEGDKGYKPYNLELAKVSEMVKRTVNANRGEVFVDLEKVINLYHSVKKRVEKAEKEGRLVLKDQKRIYQLIGSQELALAQASMTAPTRSNTREQTASSDAVKATTRTRRVIKRRAAKPQDVTAHMADKIAA